MHVAVVVSARAAAGGRNAARDGDEDTVSAMSDTDEAVEARAAAARSGQVLSMSKSMAVDDIRAGQVADAQNRTVYFNVSQAQPD
jgi:hypothetical protein